MGSDDDSPDRAHTTGTSDDVLGSWKEIAAYLQRDLRTVMRWERSRGLPVRRLPGESKAAVFALKSELDSWRTAVAKAPPRHEGSGTTDGRGNVPAGADGNRPPHRGRGAAVGVAIVGVLLLATVVALTLGARSMLRSRRPAAAPIRSLAVLPFQNLNKDPGLDYFADGLHETLLTDLARVGGIPVISRTSVERYRGGRVPTKQIAGELRVDALVEGSVLRVGDRVRITAQLVRGDTEEHVWANSYDNRLSDVLRLLGRVSQDITAEIQNAVAGTQTAAERGALPGPVRPDALDAHLRGRYAMQSMTAEGLATALVLQREAVRLDPDFSMGWASLGAARALQVFFGFVSPADAISEAREASRRALALDPTVGVAHGSLGFIALYCDWDFRAARNELERAVALSPNNAMTRHEYGDYLMVTGRLEESLQQVRIGQVNDPFSPVARAVVLYHALMARRYAEVETGVAELIRMRGPENLAREVLGRALWVQGRHSDALNAWKAAFGLSEAAVARLDQASSKGGPRAALLELARQRAPAARDNRQGGAVNEAGMFAAAGDSEQAFRWLEESYARHEPFLLHVVGDPLFDPLRADPRMTGLLRRMGIDPAVSALATASR